MKIFCSLALITLLCLPLVNSRAGSVDLEINSLAKKVDQNEEEAKKLAVTNKGSLNTTYGQITKKQEHWCYALSIENKAFQPLIDVDVKYIIYYKVAQLGSTAQPREQQQSGEDTIKLIGQHAKQSLDTAAVELNTQAVVGNFYAANGSKLKVEDSLTGVWVRLYQNGVLIAEYARPTSIPTKKKWDDDYQKTGKN